VIWRAILFLSILPTTVTEVVQFYDKVLMNYKQKVYTRHCQI